MDTEKLPVKWHTLLCAKYLKCFLPFGQLGEESVHVMTAPSPSLIKTELLRI